MTFECHQLTISDGRAELAYLGEKPWHGLGQSIREGATIEETERAAGMAWRIGRAAVTGEVLRPRTMPDGTEENVGVTIDVPDRVILFRDDTLAPLSVVSRMFQEVQPRQALEFFRSMTEAGGYTMESAGTLRGGRVLFAAVKTSQGFTLPGDDRVEGRLLFSTACDGTMATTIREVSIRVICRNTLNAAIAGSKGTVTVRHNTRFDADRAREQLRTVSESFNAFATAAAALTRVQMTERRAQDFLAALLPTPAFGNVSETRGFKTIMDLFNGAGIGSELASARGTVWGWLNAVTEYVDHRSPTRSADNRQTAALFGAGAALKSNALALALQAV